MKKFNSQEETQIAIKKIKSELAEQSKSKISMSEVLKKLKKPFFLAALITTTTPLQGAIPMSLYSVRIFSDHYSDKWALYLTNFQSFVGILGGLLSMVLIERLGRKTLYIAGLITFFIIVIFLALITQYDGPMWIFTMLISSASFVFAATSSPLHFALCSDLLPGIAIGYAQSLESVSLMIVLYSLPVLAKTSFGFTGCLWVFAIVNLFMALISIGYLNETKDKSQRQIWSELGV